MPREDGYFISTDLESDKVLLECPTVQCVHCGRHWQVLPGSGKTRGWCMNCHGPVCGPKCAECVPQEQLLENYEQGRPRDYRPQRTSVVLNVDGLPARGDS